MATATDFKFGVLIAYIRVLVTSAQLGHRGPQLGQVATF